MMSLLCVMAAFWASTTCVSLLAPSARPPVYHPLDVDHAQCGSMQHPCTKQQLLAVGSGIFWPFTVAWTQEKPKTGVPPSVPTTTPPLSLCGNSTVGGG